MAGGAPDPILTTPGGTPFKFGLEILTQGWDSNVGQRLIAAARRMNDPGLLARNIARKVVQSQKQNILEQRDPAGVPWEPLKHSRGPGRNPGNRALFDSGRLYEAITYVELGGGSVKVGVFGVPYAKFPIGGTRPFNIYPRSNVAKRKAVVMRFWSGTGWVFTKSIHHPGVPARNPIGVRLGDVPTIQQMAAAYALAAFDQAAA